MTSVYKSNELGFKYRLHKRSEFLGFFKNPEVFKIKCCVIFRVKNTFFIPRLGITFKGKFTSVERNYIRRSIREEFRIRKEKLGTYDYNFVVKRFKRTFREELKLGLNKIF